MHINRDATPPACRTGGTASQNVVLALETLEASHRKHNLSEQAAVKGIKQVTSQWTIVGDGVLTPGAPPGGRPPPCRFEHAAPE